MDIKFYVLFFYGIVFYGMSFLCLNFLWIFFLWNVFLCDVSFYGFNAFYGVYYDQKNKKHHLFRRIKIKNITKLFLAEISIEL